MRNALILLFIGVLQTHAIDSYSQKTRLSLNFSDTELTKVLDKIEVESEFFFMYNEKLLDTERKVSITAKDQLIDVILDNLFAGTDVKYTIIDRKIILAPDYLTEVSQPQQKRIAGTITDKNGTPLPGVNVVVSGTTLGAITDIAGKYSIEVPQGSKSLKFSFIGMQPQEISIGTLTQIDVTMAESAIGLDEVVVVGYGVQKKVDVIGSISQISSEKLSSRSVPLLSNALVGQMTGVTIITGSGDPGGTGYETIRVRGEGSFGATPNALVLIDGIQGNINDVGTEEVESISVLKDASSAAIYGARAANGVILITTKAGESGKVKVNYDAYGGFAVPTTLPKMLNSWDYALAMNEATGTEIYSPEDIEKFKDGSDPVNFPNSDFLKEVVNRRGFRMGHDLSLQGGTDISQYYVGFGYLSQEGVIKKNSFNRYNLRINMISRLTPKLKVTTRIGGFSSITKEPSTPGNIDCGGDVSQKYGILTNLVRYGSIYPIYLPNGDYGLGLEGIGTPVAWINSSSFYENPIWKINGAVSIEYKPMKDLILSATGGYVFNHFESKGYRATMRLNDDVTLGPSNLTNFLERTQYQTFQGTADYNKNIGEHALSVLLGYSFEKEGSRNMTAYRDKFPSNDIPYLSAGSPDNQQSNGGGYEWAIQSVFGRIRYNYKEKYLFETTMRNDGSSKFPPKHKYGLFPSFAVGWRISEEPFLRDNLNWISNLKLKASWGKLGNQNIGNYDWQPVYEFGSNYVFGGVLTQGTAMTSLIDPNLHWESTQTIDGGFESSLWKGKMNFNVTYFYRKTTDILYKPTASVSTVLGMNLSAMNTGSMKNSGLEIELGHQNTIGEFSYHINGNFTLVQNKVLDLGVGNVTQPNGLIGNGSSLFIGYPMKLYYGLVTDGVFLDQADINEWYKTNDQSSLLPLSNAKPGDFRYVDLSGDGKVDVSHDRKILGSQIPKYNFSFNLGFDYKGFDFSAMLQGVAGVNGYLGGCAGTAFRWLGSIQEWMWNGRFDPANPTRYPEYPRLEVIAGNSPNVILSDFWVLNASYLRIKNLQLGYTLSPHILKKLYVDGLRIYASAENLVTFDNYREGWDPEINGNGEVYPLQTTYTFGINLKF